MVALVAVKMMRKLAAIVVEVLQSSWSSPSLRLHVGVGSAGGAAAASRVVTTAGVSHCQQVSDSEAWD